MRKIFLLIASSFNVLFALAQDEQKSIEITVNSDEPVEMEFKTCDLSYSAFSDGSSIILTVDVRNTSNDYIYLFAKELTKKELRKQKIRFDKKAYGSTSRRLLVFCDSLGIDDVIKIGPLENEILTIDNIDKDRKRLELPLYLAKYKRHILCMRYNIKSRIKLISNISFIEEKTDDKYEDIEKRCLELIDEIDHFTVCPRASHPESIEKQKKPYTDRILDLKDEISDIKTANGWRERDEEYQKYKILISQLEDVVFNEKYCGKCGQTASESHRCKFCDMTTQDILNSIDRIYSEYIEGSISRNTAISELEPLHRAWTGGCPKLKQKMDRDDTGRANIERYYNRIIK